MDLVVLLVGETEDLLSAVLVAPVHLELVETAVARHPQARWLVSLVETMEVAVVERFPTPRRQLLQAGLVVLASFSLRATSRR